MGDIFIFSQFVHTMDSIGKVNKVGNNTLAKLMKRIEERKITPTHFLILQFTYHANLEKKYKQSIPKAFFDKLNERKYWVTFSSAIGDSSEITWSSENEYQSSIFWTTSRLAETYVNQMTKKLLLMVYNEVLQSIQLNPGCFQLSMLITKNLTHVIDLEVGEESAITNL